MMKTLKHIIAIVALSATVIACKNETKPEVKTVQTNAEKTVKQLDPNATYAKAEFSIDGMTCAIGCAKTIEKKIAQMDGVKSATVDFDTKLAMVEFDESKVSTNSLEEAVSQAGEMYKVHDMKTVDEFSKDKKHQCKPDCKKSDCKDKASKDKKSCSEDCKKACCAEKTKA